MLWWVSFPSLLFIRIPLSISFHKIALQILTKLQQQALVRWQPKDWQCRGHNTNESLFLTENGNKFQLNYQSSFLPTEGSRKVGLPSVNNNAHFQESIIAHKMMPFHSTPKMCTETLLQPLKRIRKQKQNHISFTSTATSVNKLRGLTIQTEYALLKTFAINNILQVWWQMLLRLLK